MAILLVDDDVDSLTTYERMLSGCGRRIVAVTTRAAALEALRREHFALVVLEFRLVDGAPLDVIEAAAAPPKAAVIVTTRFPSGLDRARALRAGASAYLVKPFATGTFKRLVNYSVLHARRQRQGTPGA